LARHSALHATTDDIELLRRALEANREARHDIEQFIDTDVAFHFVLAEIARNPIFTTLHQAMAAWLREQRATGVKAPGSLEAAISAHARIFDAVASKDADGAEHEMRQHMVQVADYYWSAKKVVPE
jgi:GntR family transcriptional repressor for pyruvate dehydrogenase complex